MPGKKPKIIISACLLGEKCRYDNIIIKNEKALQLAGEYCLVPVCPEMLGGLPTPRPRAEIESGDGFDVIDGRSRVLTDSGNDVTDHFLKGAYEALRAALENEISRAVLKSKSPSCGVKNIIRNGRHYKGMGITAALLRRNRIMIEEMD
jgi:uncharacterized protein YbbK (DUF523 family)